LLIMINLIRVIVPPGKVHREPFDCLEAI